MPDIMHNAGWLPEDVDVEGLGDHEEVGDDEGQVRQAEAGQKVVKCVPH